MIEKTIYEDIASFYSLKTQNLEVFKKILYFIATTKPGSMSINQLANSLSKDHTTTAEYLQILKDTGLLLFLMNEKTGKQEEDGDYYIDVKTKTAALS